MLNCDKKQLYLIFNKNFNKSVKDYITDKKIDYAKNLLKTTNLSVTLIAEKCGFGDYNNFIQRFKSIMGATPLKYRKTFQTKE